MSKKEMPDVVLREMICDQQMVACLILIHGAVEIIMG